MRIGNLREDHDKPRKTIADAIGVSDTAVWQWDTGNKSPKIPSVIAYAAQFNHRIVVRRNGRIICDLADALPRLAELRQAAGLTMRELARILHIVFNSVCNLERDVGPASCLSTVERYLVGCGYQVALVPADMAVAA